MTIPYSLNPIHDGYLDPTYYLRDWMLVRCDAVQTQEEVMTLEYNKKQ